MKLKDLLNVIDMEEELYIFDNNGFMFNDYWHGQTDLLDLHGNCIVTNIMAGDAPSIMIEIE
jgi:hypothetical protein